MVISKNARLPEGVAGLSGVFSWLGFTLIKGRRRAARRPVVIAVKRRATETLRECNTKNKAAGLCVFVENTNSPAGCSGNRFYLKGIAENGITFVYRGRSMLGLM